MSAIDLTFNELFQRGPRGAFAEIAEDTFGVNGSFWGFPNVLYLLRSGSAWTLIDAGIAETPEHSIAPFLEGRGGVESIEFVLGTHGHLDHIGGNGWIKLHSPKTRFGLGALDAGWAENVELHYHQLYELGAPSNWQPDDATSDLIREACGEPVAIDRPFVGGEVVTFGEGRQIDAIHLGAHSPGQMMYVDRLTGIAFTGDAVQNAGILSETTGERDFPMYRTVSDYRRSLEIIRAQNATMLCTAHAGIFLQDDVDAFIDDAYEWMTAFDNRIQEIAGTLRDFSLEEMVASLGEMMPEYALTLQVRVTTSEHLDGFVRRGTLHPYIAFGNKRWRVVEHASRGVSA
ncbi:MAG: hypothetical protein JWQ43_1608 [Glaciihabitans sp.]|nr:hypothetical protein [Glaciihabitans sp.]